MSSPTTPAEKHALPDRLHVFEMAWIKALAGIVVLSLLVLTAGLLVSRRFAGALRDPLTATQLASAACGLAAAALAVRLLNKDTHPLAGSGWGRLLIAATPTAAVFAAAVALSLPGSSTAGLVVLWSTIVAAEAFSFARLAFRSGTIMPKDAIRSANTVSEPPPTPPLPTSVCEEALSHTPADKELITQRIVRSQDADGGDVISGTIRAVFLAGQRTASVHVAFCPPFSAQPTVEVQQIDGPPGRVKAVQLLPYGARFDVKLLQDATDSAVVALCFSARC